MSHDPRFIDRPDCGETKTREQRVCSECEHTCLECGDYAAEAQLCRECTEVLHR